MEKKKQIYEYDGKIEAADHGGTFIRFPWDIRRVFSTGRIKVSASFDGVPYQGSIVNMGLKNEDGSICYIIGIRKDIRKKIKKEPGDTVHVVIEENTGDTDRT